MALAPNVWTTWTFTPHFFSSGCPPTAFNYILNGDLISAQETHRDVGIIMSSDLSWREHMKIFYPEHIKLSTLFDIHLACTVHQDSLFVPSSFTAYILFTDLASPPSERHHNSWKDPALCDQIHPKRLQFWLQISSNCSQDSTLDDATELYDVMFFIRSLKGPINAFNIYDHVTFHTGSTRSSTHLKLKHVLSRTKSARHFYFKRMPRLWNSTYHWLRPVYWLY